jgi:hypothetical protein
MKPRRAADRPTDWLTARKETSAPSKAKGRVTPISSRRFAAILKGRDPNPEKFAGVIDRLRHRADESREWLKKRGWQLWSGHGQFGRKWRNPGKAPGERCLWSSNDDDSTAEEKASFDIFQYASAAVWSAEHDECPAAMHFAFLAGFATGLSHARVRQSEQKRGRRRSEIREEAMQKLRDLVAKHGPQGVRKMAPEQLKKEEPWFITAKISDENIRQILRAFKKAL